MIKVKIIIKSDGLALPLEPELEHNPIIGHSVVISIINSFIYSTNHILIIISPSKEISQNVFFT